MRLLAGADVAAEEDDATAPAAGADWTKVVAGPWLAATLKGLRSPQGLADVDPGDALAGILRPYQQVGVRWLYLLTKLGLGACLADDMGLGKTIQVLSLLLVLKRQESTRPQPSLLVAPASLLANWAAEIERLAPGLKPLIAHPSALPPAELKALDAARLRDIDLVITSYGSLLRVPWMLEVPWRLAVLDEAQAITNPDAKQTRAVKKLKAGARLALTGTPVENRLGDLGSIFDFVNPGLLGTVALKIAPVVKPRWKSICTDCAGAIDSLVELLQGRLSNGVMERICRQGHGLFPSPDEIKLSCSCPDWAGMCKHVAAVLYGIGARLDRQPELLFRLRGVDEKELIVRAGQADPLTKSKPPAAKRLGGEDLAAIFGIDMERSASRDAEPSKKKRAKKTAEAPEGKRRPSKKAVSAPVRKRARKPRPAAE
jgi:hypothetical protein